MSINWLCLPSFSLSNAFVVLFDCYLYLTGESIIKCYWWNIKEYYPLQNIILHSKSIMSFCTSLGVLYNILRVIIFLKMSALIFSWSKIEPTIFQSFYWICNTISAGPAISCNKYVTSWCSIFFFLSSDRCSYHYVNPVLPGRWHRIPI